MNNLSIIILAAGKGSRMKSTTAKVLHTISGAPMLSHIIEASLERSDDVTVVVAHQKEAVTEAMRSRFENLAFLEQDIDDHPGTGGALFGYAPKYEQVLVLNGDMPLITGESLEAFLQSDADIVMSIFDLDNPSGYGRVVISDAGVERIVEEKDASKAEKKITHVNAGVYRFSRTTLEDYLPRLDNNNAQGEYYLTDLIAMARADGLSIEPLLVDDIHFMGVNSKAHLAEAEVIMQTRIRERWMNEGVIMQLPHTIYIETDVTFEGECIIENGCRITGNTLIHTSHIKAHSIIEESIVKNSDIGPLAHVRPQSHIEETHIGNFVEIKKSSLKGVKAGHLSYLGDAIIDEGTNVGAGTITCNYDGKKKYQTVIGKNVFIGSDTQIVAPCVIEDDVIIAAGTTVAAAKIEKGSLAISRTPMKKLAGFYYKFFGNRS